LIPAPGAKNLDLVTGVRSGASAAPVVRSLPPRPGMLRDGHHI
jgi:hypothetical protein